MKRVLSSFFLIINYKTIIVTVLALVSTFICIRYNLTAKFPDMLVGVAIVFPVVFSIGSAYNRRETALQRLSDFKGHAVALYFATRDWTTQKENDLPKRSRKMIMEMIHLMREMFKTSHDADWSKNVALFFLSCVLVAGIYGALTASKRIFFVQAVPAILGLLSFMLQLK